MDEPRPREGEPELAEMLREAERVLDRQLEAMEREERKSELILQLGSATLAGGLAVATFFAKGEAATDGVALLVFLAGGAQNIAGLLLFSTGTSASGEGWTRTRARTLRGSAPRPGTPFGA